MTQVAIDGPGGAGKSTIAKAVAKELGWIYVDTGAMYRAVGLSALKRGLSIRQQQAEVEAMVQSLDIRLRFSEGCQRIFLEGEDVSEAIRTPEVSLAASDVSAISKVREALLERQRQLAETENVVMDGRDIGTVVLPHARVKLFLTASAEERARRRHRELAAKGEEVPFEQVLADLCYRDKQDSTRAAAPLRMAKDAVLVDTTGLSLEQSTAKVLELIRERI